MNERIKKIANKLSENIRWKGINQIYYDLFNRMLKTSMDYFNRFSANDMLKLVIYIYSIKNFNNTTVGDKIIETAWVGNYLRYEEDDFENETCDNCAGDGDIRCDNCDRDGNEECRTCSGSGSVFCESCGGDGEDDEGGECDECNGTGEFTCDQCEGAGLITCRSCGGDVYERCLECEGDGSIETEKLNYTKTSFMTWDPILIESFRNSYELDKPIFIDSNFEDYKDENKLLILNEESDSGKFFDFVEPDYEYCYFFDRFPSEHTFRSSPAILNYRAKPSNHIENT
jgi:hypothetical protein